MFIPKSQQQDLIYCPCLGGRGGGSCLGGVREGPALTGRSLPPPHPFLRLFCLAGIARRQDMLLSVYLKSKAEREEAQELGGALQAGPGRVRGSTHSCPPYTSLASVAAMRGARKAACWPYPVPMHFRIFYTQLSVLGLAKLFGTTKQNVRRTHEQTDAHQADVS